MYTREIQAPRGAPIEKGIPLTGTWNNAFARVDLLGIQRPYSWPLPRWLKDFRIKEWEVFSVQDERFSLDALLGNFKLFRLVQICLYNTETGQYHVYRKLLPGSGWRMPQSLNHATVECRSAGFFFRIHTWLNADTIKLDMDVAATKRHPALTAHLAYCLGDYPVTPVAVSLKITERRNMYVFKALTAVRGDLVLGDRHISLNSASCTGIFCDYKGFYPYRMKGVFCGCTGFDSEGRRYGFHIVENQAKETYINNENVLWVNDCCTPLPPVRITMPDNPESDWVIQDLDGMVDLQFTPKAADRFGGNLLVVRGDFFAPVGYYNGVLVSSNNEQIQVRNQLGTGGKIYVRV